MNFDPKEFDLISDDLPAIGIQRKYIELKENTMRSSYVQVNFG